MFARMIRTIDRLVATPVALTDETSDIAGYARSSDGRAAIERGLADIRQRRIYEGKDALRIELKRRTAILRQAHSSAASPKM